MNSSDFEQKTADRFHDMFHVEWAHGVEATVVFLTSIWFYAGVVRVRLDNSKVAPRPLSWWRDQLAQMGVHYPPWLGRVTAWHAPHHATVVLGALVLVAVAASIASGTNRAPGYELGAVLALVLSAQWFGLGRSLKAFLLVVGLVTATASLLAIRTWIRTRFELGSADDDRIDYSPESILVGLLKGPIGLLITPALYPIGMLNRAVVSFGYSRERHIPTQVETLRDLVARADENEWTLLTMPAGHAIRAMVALQQLPNSTEARRWTRSLVLSTGPTGARPLQSGRSPVQRHYSRAV